MRGEEQHFKSPRDAIALGIGMVHQHFMLADNLTVTENVVLGQEPGSAVWLDFDAAKERIAELGEIYGLPVKPDAFVAELGVGDRQRVEIMKVLYRGARILILDEPTAVLVPQEVDELFDSLRDLTAEGVTVIFISHKLDEVLSVADAITVIRAGRTVASVLPEDVTARELAELMVGSELPKPDTRESTVTDKVILEVSGLTVIEEVRAVLDHVSLTVHSGEVVGVAGVDGNGQRELVEALVGLRGASSGRVTLGGVDITHASTRFRREQGVGYIPEDRQHDGLLLSAAALGERDARAPDTRALRPRLLIDKSGARAQTEQIVERLRRAHAGRRRRGVCPLGRQPAEARRRTGDARATKVAHRLASDAGDRRRRAGRGVGQHPPGPVGRTGSAVALGRPRGADRAVGHAARDPRAATSSPRSTRRP